jgi:hypothetical protein
MSKQQQQPVTREIHNLLVLNTCHIAEGDNYNLTEAPGLLPPSGVVFNLGDGCGFLMSVDPEVDPEYDTDTWSPALLAIHALAVSLGCSYVRLDPDGPVDPELKTYEW